MTKINLNKTLAEITLTNGKLRGILNEDSGNGREMTALSELPPIYGEDKEGNKVLVNPGDMRGKVTFEYRNKNGETVQKVYDLSEGPDGFRGLINMIKSKIREYIPDHTVKGHKSLSQLLDELQILFVAPPPYTPIDTMATDGGNIFINPAFMDEFLLPCASTYNKELRQNLENGNISQEDKAKEELNFYAGVMYVLFHELMHCYLGHFKRQEAFRENIRKGKYKDMCPDLTDVDHRKANWVQDQEINSEIESNISFIRGKQRVFVGKKIAMNPRRKESYGSLTKSIHGVLFNPYETASTDPKAPKDPNLPKRKKASEWFYAKDENGNLLHDAANNLIADKKWEDMYLYLEANKLWDLFMPPQMSQNGDGQQGQGQEQTFDGIGCQDDYDNGFRDAYMGISKDPKANGNDAYAQGYEDGLTQADIYKKNGCYTPLQYLMGVQNGKSFLSGINKGFEDINNGNVHTSVKDIVYGDDDLDEDEIRESVDFVESLGWTDNETAVLEGYRSGAMLAMCEANGIASNPQQGRVYSTSKGTWRKRPIMDPSRQNQQQQQGGGLPPIVPTPSGQQPQQSQGQGQGQGQQGNQQSQGNRSQNGQQGGQEQQGGGQGSQQGGSGSQSANGGQGQQGGKGNGPVFKVEANSMDGSGMDDWWEHDKVTAATGQEICNRMGEKSNINNTNANTWDENIQKGGLGLDNLDRSSDTTKSKAKGGSGSGGNGAGSGLSLADQIRQQVDENNTVKVDWLGLLGEYINGEYRGPDERLDIGKISRGRYGKEPNPHDFSPSPGKVLFVVDESGSVWGRGGGDGKEAFRVFFSQVKQLVDGIPGLENTDILVAPFSDNTGDNFKTVVFPGADIDLQKLWDNMITGGTNFNYVFTAICSEGEPYFVNAEDEDEFALEPGEMPKVVIMCTDGEDRIPPYSDALWNDSFLVWFIINDKESVKSIYKEIVDAGWNPKRNCGFIGVSVDDIKDTAFVQEGR